MHIVSVIYLHKNIKIKRIISFSSEIKRHVKEIVCLSPPPQCLPFFAAILKRHV